LIFFIRYYYSFS